MGKTTKMLDITKKVVAVGLVLFCLYTSTFGVLINLLQRSIFFLLAIIMVFLKVPDKDTKHPKLELIFGFILIVVTCISTIHLMINYEIITAGIQPLTTYEYVLGVTLILCVLVATKKLVGWPIVIIAVMFLVYGRFGNLLPTNFLGHRGYSVQRIVSHLYAGINGIFGTPMGAAASLVAMFTIYASFLEGSGGSKLFLDVAVAFTGKKPGGPAKCAVLSSAFFGIISGAAVTNVVTTGTFTIPLMKRTGYSDVEAGAIEEVASTGGQLMPPVMGAAAFIMVEYLGIPYRTIALAALMPSVIYYIALFMIVHLKAVKKGLKGIDVDQISVKQIMKERGLSLISIIVLIVMLIMGYSPMRAALFGIVTAFVFSWFSPKTRIKLKQMLPIFENAAKNMLVIAVVCAAAGIIIGTFSLTGVGVRLGGFVVLLAEGRLIIALLLAFVVVLIMGMGMPTAVAYILVATLVAPALVELGVLPLAAHMFVLYGAVLSAITPPVAMAAFAASSISGANPMKIGFAAMKLAIVAFIIPFFFVYQPALLLQGGITEIILAVATSIVGCLFLAVGLEGFLFKKINMILRLILTVSALMMIYPGAVTDTIGAVAALVIFGVEYAKKRVTEKVAAGVANTGTTNTVRIRIGAKKEKH